VQQNSPWQITAPEGPQGNVLGFESDDIAIKPLAVDGEIEQRRVALAVCQLKFGTDRPGARNRSRFLIVSLGGFFITAATSAKGILTV
jgi:hypothetical protein